eukprot:351002-Chlamydomonas_euryale.AAC.12
MAMTSASGTRRALPPALLLPSSSLRPAPTAGSSAGPALDHVPHPRRAGGGTWAEASMNLPPSVLVHGCCSKCDARAASDSHGRKA